MRRRRRWVCAQRHLRRNTDDASSLCRKAPLRSFDGIVRGSWRYAWLSAWASYEDAHVFGTVEGEPRDPDRITQDWKRLTAARGLPKVTLQALRHSHASALIASGTDPVTVSRRLGHGSPTITLSVYAHLFDRSDEAAAKAIDLVLGATEI